MVLIYCFSTHAGENYGITQYWGKNYGIQWQKLINS